MAEPNTNNTPGPDRVTELVKQAEGFVNREDMIQYVKSELELMKPSRKEIVQAREEVERSEVLKKNDTAREALLTEVERKRVEMEEETKSASPEANTQEIKELQAKNKELAKQETFTGGLQTVSGQVVDSILPKRLTDHMSPRQKTALAAVGTVGLGVLAYFLFFRGKKGVEAGRQASNKGPFIALGIAILAFLGIKAYQKYDRDALVKKSKAKAKEWSQKGVEKGMEKIQGGADKAKDIEQKTDVFGGIGRDVAARGLLIMHSSLKQRAGIDEQSDTAVTNILQFQNIRSIPITEIVALGDMENYNEAQSETKKIWEKYGPKNPREEQLHALYFLGLVCKQHEKYIVGTNTKSNNPLTIEDALHKLVQPAEAFDKVKRGLAGKDLTQLPAVLHEAFNTHINIELPHIGTALEKLGLSTKEEMRAFVLFCSSHPEIYLSHTDQLPDAIEPDNPYKEKFLRAFTNLSQNVNRGKKYFGLYLHDDRFKPALEKYWNDKMELSDALQLYLLLDQVPTQKGELPHSTSDTPPLVAAMLQLQALKMVSFGDEDTGTKMKAFLFSEAANTFMGMPTDIHLPPAAKEFLNEFGAIVWNMTKHEAKNLVQLPRKGFMTMQEIYHKNKLTVLGTEAAGYIVWRSIWAADNAGLKLAENVGSTMAPLLMEQKAILVRTLGKIPVIRGPALALNKVTPKVTGMTKIGLVGVALDAQDFYLDRRPKILEELGKTTDPIKKKLLEDELFNQQMNFAINGAAVLAPTPWGIGIFAANGGKEAIRKSINEGTYYILQTEAEMREIPPGADLWQIMRTTQGNVNMMQGAANIGNGNAVEKANEQIRTEAYRAYFHQITWSLGDLGLEFLKPEEIQMNEEEQKKRLKILNDEQKTEFVNAAEEYIRHVTKKHFGIVGPEELRNAETYARCDIIDWRRSKLTGEPMEVGKLPWEDSRNEKGELIKGRLNMVKESTEAQKEIKTAGLNALPRDNPAEFTMGTLMMFLKDIEHDIASFEAKILSENLDRWEWTGGEEESRNAARQTTAFLIQRTLATEIDLLLRMSTITPDAYELAIKNLRMILNGDPLQYQRDGTEKYKWQSRGLLKKHYGSGLLSMEGMLAYIEGNPYVELDSSLVANTPDNALPIEQILNQKTDTVRMMSNHFFVKDAKGYQLIPMKDNTPLGDAMKNLRREIPSNEPYRIEAGAYAIYRPGEEIKTNMYGRPQIGSATLRMEQVLPETELQNKRLLKEKQRKEGVAILKQAGAEEQASGAFYVLKYSMWDKALTFYFDGETGKWKVAFGGWQDLESNRRHTSMSGQNAETFEVSGMAWGGSEKYNTVIRKIADINRLAA